MCDAKRTRAALSEATAGEARPESEVIEPLERQQRLLTAVLLTQRKGPGAKSHLLLQDPSFLPLPEQQLLEPTLRHRIDSVWRMEQERESVK